MPAKIEEVEREPSMSELPGDDTALYRISGWALKSAIDLTTKAFKQENAREEVQHQLHLLNSLNRPNARYSTLRGPIPRSWWTDIHAAVITTIVTCSRG